jgi:hypothetical protein
VQLREKRIRELERVVWPAWIGANTTVDPLGLCGLIKALARRAIEPPDLSWLKPIPHQRLSVPNYYRDSKLIPYVYFVGSTVGGPVKIGTATSIEQRVRDLQCGSPLELVVLGICFGDCSVERRLHAQLGKYRHHGEWFEPSGDVYLHIVSLTLAMLRGREGDRPILFKCQRCERYGSRYPGEKEVLCRTCLQSALSV